MVRLTPTQWPLRRSAVSAQLLTQFGLDQGLSLERCLHGTGLNLAQLGDPGAEIDAAQELCLIRNLVQGLGHLPGLGLKVGPRYHLSTYGIWGFALLSSPTFRSAAQIGLRYLDLTYAFHGMRLEEVGEHAHLVLDERDVPEDLRTFILERDTAGLMHLQRDLTATRFPLISVSFRLPAPADPSAYRDVFGLTPTFDAPENRIVFERRFLDQPLPGANPEVARHCEQQCQTLLNKRRIRAGLSGRIRDRLLSQPGRLPDMEQLASELHMTSRTLRRRLEEEGTRFRLLQDEVRQAIAEELLGIDSLTLEDIAERLSYGDVSNFIHAFKRWKGLTPGQYRSQRVPVATP
ncbi:AraC family transcriptional regulator [Pseudomonas sp.]|uniref:AraC family transcriptional regulator n=1 Tax=Pseudomonas sp. TaxID=306 RepID=UPI003D0F80A7